MFIIIVSLSTYFYLSSASGDRTHIEDKLSTNKEFYEHWMQLISLQADQLEQQNQDYPLSLISLKSCTPILMTNSEDTANSLRPSSISIYADIGHMSFYCKSNVTLLRAGILDSCDHQSSSMNFPSLNKMLRIFNPDLIVVDSNKRDDSLVDQARQISSSVWKIEGYENDGQASETRQTAVEILDAVEEFHKLLPQKTFIVVIRTSGSGIWSDANRSHKVLAHTVTSVKACKEILSLWKSHSHYNSISVWDQMEAIVRKNFQKPNFTVEVFPLLRQSTLSDLLDEMDFSVLGYDCAHFSERGLSLLHTAIWNSFFTKNNERLREYRPLASPLLCPDFRCPFLRTATNSEFCIWNPKKVVEKKTGF
ncbi:hypothetical protein DICVIV_00193 [Dictyocaulus viviparus]|uniref:SGNH domain-containing protein n=1 Tax=Dictyocaulus viviparus TaxID=29172 RepID=A0A0D8YCJ9_DICVI|nr:hypothetical protein DICVIV_00193 [Dictyocaulus viviparus]